MQVNQINNNQNTTFQSQIIRTNSLGYGVRRAIEKGDKGFFNAIKHLKNDGLERKIITSGSNSTVLQKITAKAILIADDLEYTLTTTQDKKRGLDAYQLMGENIIELIKRLASETGSISRELLDEKATKDVLLNETKGNYWALLSDKFNL